MTDVTFTDAVQKVADGVLADLDADAERAWERTIRSLPKLPEGVLGDMVMQAMRDAFHLGYSACVGDLLKLRPDEEGR